MPRKTILTSLFALLAGAAQAQETREVGAHEHGVTTAQIAIEDGTLTIDIVSPGMDIVGFEHEPVETADRQAVAAAVLTLARAGEIVEIDPSAGCLLTEVRARLRGEDHDDGENEADMHQDDDHEGDGEDEAARAEGDAHSEFHARYVYDCADASAARMVGFPFFDAFPGAAEIEAEYVTGSGAGRAEVARGATLTLD